MLLMSRLLNGENENNNTATRTVVCMYGKYQEEGFYGNGHSEGFGYRSYWERSAFLNSE